MRSIQLVLLLLPALSCATTADITSVKDPSAVEGRYRHIVVAVPMDRLGLRESLENAFVERLGEDGVSATPSLLLLPPTREYSEEEIVTAVKGAGAQGILIVALSGAHQSHSPLVGNVPSRALVFDRNVYQFEASLFDAKGLKQVWLATSEGSTNILSGVDALGPDLADRIVSKLRSDGLLP